MFIILYILWPRHYTAYSSYQMNTWNFPKEKRSIKTIDISHICTIQYTTKEQYRPILLTKSSQLQSEYIQTNLNKKIQLLNQKKQPTTKLLRSLEPYIGKSLEMNQSNFSKKKNRKPKKKLITEMKKILKIRIFESHTLMPLDINSKQLAEDKAKTHNSDEK